MGTCWNINANEIPDSISCDTPCCTIKDIWLMAFSQPIINACPINYSCLYRSVYTFGYISFNWYAWKYEPCLILFRSLFGHSKTVLGEYHIKFFSLSFVFISTYDNNGTSLDIFSYSQRLNDSNKNNVTININH